MDLTALLAVLQTIAGFGAIAATIAFTMVQRTWSRDDELRRKLEFIWAATDLIGGFSAVTDKLLAAIKLDPDAPAAGQVRLEWITAWGVLRDAMAALRAHSVSDAPIILSLAQCVRTLDRASTVQHAGSAAQIALQAGAFRDELLKERACLFEREAELTPRQKRLRRRARS